jgi:hypothetical protein
LILSDLRFLIFTFSFLPLRTSIKFYGDYHDNISDLLPPFDRFMSPGILGTGRISLEEIVLLSAPEPFGWFRSQTEPELLG